jgi:thiamine-phosphate diphosphorylase
VTVPRLHAVTTDEILARPDFLDRARAVMRAVGPRGAVHLRGHGTTAARLHALARALAPLQSGGGWLVVNDRVDVALAAGARGVQLTSRSMRTADARRVAPELAVGASVHAAAEASVAAAEGAAWVVAGNVAATPTHPGAEPRGRDFLRAVVAAAGAVPVVAIGGVRPDDVPALRAAGAHGVAAIRGVWDAADAERAAIAYLSSYDGDRT